MSVCVCVILLHVRAVPAKSDARNFRALINCAKFKCGYRLGHKFIEITHQQLAVFSSAYSQSTDTVKYLAAYLAAAFREQEKIQLVISRAKHSSKTRFITHTHTHTHTHTRVNKRARAAATCPHVQQRGVSHTAPCRTHTHTHTYIQTTRTENPQRTSKP